MSEYTLSRISQNSAIKNLAGPWGRPTCEAMTEAKAFLDSHTADALLRLTGRKVDGLGLDRTINKAVIQRSYGGGIDAETDDLLAAKDLFYITEQGRLFLDCTAGHYQMTWGYDHPRLTHAAIEAMKAGVVPDNHSNIPQWPVKLLARKLVELANPDLPELAQPDFSRLARSTSRLNTVLLGIATGSVACSSALKIMLMQHEKLHKPSPAVFIVLKGNYHGTDFFTQNLRGMWTKYIRNMKVVAVEANDCSALEKAFSAHAEKIAGFWAEPVLMNNEAILLEKNFLRLARKLTKQTGALMAVDEIQTAFWTPAIFMYKQYGITPDILIVGKGMTAGFHPLSAIVYRRPLDMLAQYDAISTNGNAALASLVALANLDLIEGDAARIQAVSDHYRRRLDSLRAAFPRRIASINGQGLLAGIKFRDRRDAITFHTACLDSGLWLRVHVYHPGHSTILTKFALSVTPKIIDTFIDKLAALLDQTA